MIYLTKDINLPKEDLEQSKQSKLFYKDEYSKTIRKPFEKKLYWLSWRELEVVIKENFSDKKGDIVRHTYSLKI